MKKKVLFWIFRRFILPQLFELLRQCVTLFLLKLIEVVLQRLSDYLSAVLARKPAFWCLNGFP